MLTDPAPIIEVLGGLKAVSELTGCHVEAVRHWPKKRKFPAKTFVVMQTALAALGKSAPPSLWSQATLTRQVARSPRRSPQSARSAS